ncbi:peptidase M23 family protein, putative [Babesia ovis]|uniref:Peptidase M23 family protein, putative n=1 Tax=Babesia ovis TaxID=5869 RepID=A0A9W5T803_BABOV|nr:peptidase M23 family protein, putative [Babesia ovis]
MAKKNHRTAIQKRHNIVKKQMMEQQRRREERNRLKQLCNGVSSQLRSINVGHSRPAQSDEPQGDVVMTDSKVGGRGCNFIRGHQDGHLMTARRKKVLKQAMKRKRKLGT